MYWSPVPSMCSISSGLFVPIPILPELSIINRSPSPPIVLDTMKAGLPLIVTTSKAASGELSPIPTLLPKYESAEPELT